MYEYALYQIANDMGHFVIRLPPYHCQYNPLQVIRAEVKGEVAHVINTFRPFDADRFVNEAIESH
jgi:hypothetical protein